ncbi:MAG: AMP phosphorylase [Candidatus Asgardarchaeia archaeon]
MVLELTAKILDFSSTNSVVIINEIDAKRIGVHIHDRVKVHNKKNSMVCIVETTKSFIPQGKIGVFKNVAEKLDLKSGEKIKVEYMMKPISTDYIRKKMDGMELGRDEIFEIIRDIVNGSLSELEILAFVMAQKFKGLSLKEMTYMVEAMAKTGEILDFGEPVFDKHSIGGVPGNKVTLLIVPIVASANLLIPKTSSRAITSPSGTADTMEVLAPVEFSSEELKRIVKKTRGAIVWGGALDLAPADDIIINIKRPLSIDPEKQMMASIMAKKLAVGAKFLVMDIPMGEGVKVQTFEKAKELAKGFIELGHNLGINVEAAITYGSQPVGHAVGPALEAKEALEALMGKGPTSLIEKSTGIAGILLEMGGIAMYGQGKKFAKELLFSGKALKKMREIIAAQGGDPNITPEKIVLGDKTITIKATADGYITHVDNKAIKRIAKTAGAPMVKEAGVYLHGKVGYKVKEGDPLLTIYSNSETKLSQAYSLALNLKPITIEGMILSRLRK